MPGLRLFPANILTGTTGLLSLFELFYTPVLITQFFYQLGVSIHITLEKTEAGFNSVCHQEQMHMHRPCLNDPHGNQTCQLNGRH